MRAAILAASGLLMAACSGSSAADDVEHDEGALEPTDEILASDVDARGVKDTVARIRAAVPSGAPYVISELQSFNYDWWVIYGAYGTHRGMNIRNLVDDYVHEIKEAHVIVWAKRKSHKATWQNWTKDTALTNGKVTDRSLERPFCVLTDANVLCAPAGRTPSKTFTGGGNVFVYDRQQPKFEAEFYTYSGKHWIQLVHFKERTSRSYPDDHLATTTDVIQFR